MWAGVDESFGQDRTDYGLRKLAPASEARPTIRRTHKHDTICGVEDRPEMLVMSDVAVARVNQSLLLY